MKYEKIMSKLASHAGISSETDAAAATASSCGFTHSAMYQFVAREVRLRVCGGILRHLRKTLFA